LSVSGKNDEIIPPAVAIFSPSKQEIQQKSKATLVCLASGFYPDHLNLVWKVNGAKRTEGVGTDEFSTRNGSTYSLTSRLRISAQEWFNPFNRFECVVYFFKNETMESIHKFIYGDAGCALTEGMCVFSQASICMYFNSSFTDAKYKVCKIYTTRITCTSSSK
ncbi:TRBC2 protein, partial [Fregata magnificens]|nr:TRBC2 protein [Fregata magnificens]NWH55691.1 TRBC2 protein [Fregata magnificens]